MIRRHVVGVCIGRDCVTSVLTVQGTAVTKSWHPAGDSVSIAAALRQSLTDVRPKRSWPRVACHVSIEPSLVQVTRIEEMPLVATVPERLAMLSLTSGEHFLGAVESLAIVLGESDADGSVWAMAIDRDLLGVVETEVRAAGLVLRGLAPAIDLLAAIARVAESEVCHADANGVTAYGRVENGRLSETWRTSAHVDTTECNSCNAAADTAPLVVESEMATAAALAPTRARFGTQSKWRGAVRSLSVPIRNLAAIATCLTVAALCTPGLRARRDAIRASKAIEALAPDLSRAVELRHRADSLYRLRHQISQFRASGVNGLRVLSELSEILPDESYVTALSMDSTGVQATFAALRATDLLASFAASVAFDSVTLVGAVSREIHSGGISASGLQMPRQASAEVRAIEHVALRFVSRPFGTAHSQGSHEAIASTDRVRTTAPDALQRESRQ